MNGHPANGRFPGRGRFSGVARLLTTSVTGALVAGAAYFFAAGAFAADTAFRVTGLKCEFAADPLGIDVARPRLFWRVESDERGQRQTAWQVLVASSAESLAADRADLWDSGRVESDATTFNRYAGASLASSQQVFWKVRAWDRGGKVSPWSEPATWTMGLLAAGDWKGAWITSPAATETLLLRHEFNVKPGHSTLPQLLNDEGPVKTGLSDVAGVLTDQRSGAHHQSLSE